MELIEQIKKDLELNLTKLDNVPLENLKVFTEMKNMQICVDKILKHVKEKNKIRIIGDYDTDGILATTIMVQFFNDHPSLKDVDIDYFIPNRLVHGYGVSPLLVEMAKKDNIDLIVTVDNGISAVPAIDKANKLGIDVIITDHHTIPQILPSIDTMINPLLDDELKWKSISGATVAWCYCYAINKALPEKIEMGKYLDLAALTVLSDVIPLNNVNRPLLEYGFSQIKKNNRTVYDKIFTKQQRNKMKSNDIGFNLVPKINATGRLADANLGVRLFLEEEISDILAQIENINEERKSMTSDQLLLILDLAEEQNKKYNIIIVEHDNLHEGVVGILASRLCEIYKKPSIVLTKHHNELKGSARSVGTISVYDLLFKESHLLTKFGGHAGAAGLGLSPNNLEELRSNISKNLEENNKPKDYLNQDFSYNVDNLSKITLPLAKELESYEPYGSQFEKPKFIIDAKVVEILSNKDDKHYRCVIMDKMFNKSNIWFFHFVDDMNDYINKDMTISIDVDTNYWKGVQLSLIGKFV